MKLFELEFVLFIIIESSFLITYLVDGLSTLTYRLVGCLEEIEHYFGCPKETLCDY